MGFIIASSIAGLFVVIFITVSIWMFRWALS
jgi:hypothetical protein